MTLDFSTARDQMKAVFWNAWKVADWSTLVGSLSPARVEWDDFDSGTMRDPGQPFAAFFIKHFAAPQTTFRGPQGFPRRYTATGIVTVQLFAPVILRTGSTLAEKLAIIAQSAYRAGNTPDGVWFTNVVAKEIGSDGAGYYQINVVANFSYDTVQ